jgi:hypothetical protein
MVSPAAGFVSSRDADETRSRNRERAPGRDQCAGLLLMLTIARSHHLGHRLQVDAEGLQEFRGHDVEADRELQLDQCPRRQPGPDRIEGRIRRLVQFDDLVDKGERARCTSLKQLADCQ